MDVFNVELAGLPMEIKSRYDYCRWFCRNYLTDHPPVFSVYAEDDRLAELREYSPDMREEFLERDAIYSAIASKLPFYDRATLHGACISYKGKGLLFTAASGTANPRILAVLMRRKCDEDKRGICDPQGCWEICGSSYRAGKP